MCFSADAFLLLAQRRETSKTNRSAAANPGLWRCQTPLRQRRSATLRRATLPQHPNQAGNGTPSPKPLSADFSPSRPSCCFPRRKLRTRKGQVGSSPSSVPSPFQTALSIISISSQRKLLNFKLSEGEDPKSSRPRGQPAPLSPVSRTRDDWDLGPAPGDAQGQSCSHPPPQRAKTQIPSVIPHSVLLSQPVGLALHVAAC